MARVRSRQQVASVPASHVEAINRAHRSRSYRVQVQCRSCRGVWYRQAKGTTGMQCPTCGHHGTPFITNGGGK